MNRSHFLRLGLVATFAFALLAAGARVSSAAPTATMSVLMGCSRMTGTITITGALAAGATAWDVYVSTGSVSYIRGGGGDVATDPLTASFSFSWDRSVVTSGPFTTNGPSITYGFELYQSSGGYVNFVGGYTVGSSNCNDAYNGIGSTGGSPQAYYLPPQYVLGTVTATTPLYSQASNLSQVVGTLNAGQTWFIVGTAHNETWYQIFVDGPNYAWVPASTMSPSGWVPAGNALYRTSTATSGPTCKNFTVGGRTYYLCS